MTGSPAFLFGGIALATVFERLQASRPDALAALVRRGLLRPDFALEQVETAVEFRGRAETLERAGMNWEELMRHDAYRRVRGALRQVRWG